MKYAEEEAELIKQEAAIKASRAVLTCKKELEAAKQGLDAVRKVLDFSDVEEIVFGEYESQHDQQHSYFTERYVMENVSIPPPDQAVVKTYHLQQLKTHTTTLSLNPHGIY